ncbi:hypothetical protein HBA55_02180 [Pseudomaricurvus alkylphenolicus]|uniref:AraC family ligand binding domain-containing protein n=1 Tax=Pseudomaricurvus alkylphenolicus TaxID=1306991 RepID=UPI00141F85DC|nr:AraC family ligand binding domain-containing protein [Pseudomaricurvus alkylphenolicus]NIB38373.1 hypothetical protein [Pseudomaricurvus alkylphenolicus]
MARKRRFNTFKEGAKCSEYDEYPILTAGIDPQMHLSRSNHQQPFYLICQKDTVLAQMTGYGTLELKDSAMLYHDVKPGDHVYLPAGTPHRYTPSEESVQYRYKAENAGLEGVAWYCDNCGEELKREIWDTAIELPQQGYQRACEAFNASSADRHCNSCGTEHPKVNLELYRWTEITDELSQA